ncbi:30S ribosomal protein THX [Blattabacterium cuenoti]
MGKGDKKTRRGKIRNKTYGTLRPNPRNERKKKKIKNAHLFWYCYHYR